MTNNETIDILIPAYNVEKYIEKAILSLENQTYQNFKIIVADDGSTDNTNKILMNLQKQYKNISVVVKINEKSISKTRNFLLTQIKSKYFTFFDSDDYAESTYLETLYKNLTCYDADISMCGKIRHKENKKINLTNKLNDKKGLLFLNQEEAIAEMLSSKLYNGTVYCKLFKSSLLKSANFNENIHYGEDLDFCFKIFQNAQKFVFSAQPLYHYIIRNGSIVTSKFKTSKLSCLDCYDYIINNVSTNNTLLVCAKSMQGLIAIELLYYVWRDKYKDKQLKKNLKSIIYASIPYIKQNKRLSKLLRCAPSVVWLTKLM